MKYKYIFTSCRRLQCCVFTVVVVVSSSSLVFIKSMPKIEILHHDETKTNGCANEPQETSRKLKIIHFNDVYNIESGDIEPKAGAARFIHTVEELIKSDPVSTLVLFSGDAISPSNCKQRKSHFNWPKSKLKLKHDHFWFDF